MRSRRWTGLLGCAALGAMAACSATTGAPSGATLPTASTDDGTGPSTLRPEDRAAPADERRPVPAPVADLHRTVFEPSDTPVPDGGVLCLITVHDGQLSHEQFHAVVLFQGGSIATWTQAATGRVEPFLAKLAPEEGTRARGWLADVARERDGARDRFAPSTTVVGISTPAGGHVETSYFAAGETPEPLDRLVQLLKQRFEATNAR